MHKLIDVVETAEALNLAVPRPCGCLPPFCLCATGEALLADEWRAGEALLALDPHTTPEDVYAPARQAWRTARRAYDAHIGKRTAP
jgi:hypothetical protein